MNVAERQKPPPGDLVLDHVSHFVADLEAAARLLEKLGLIVTPLSAQMVDGRPAGTSNRCVMLEQGYVELLAPRPDRGLRLACFGTPDAAAEHRRLTDHGFKPGAVVDLSRKIPSGKLARFKVVRPGPETMPEARIQYVQHLTPQHLWQKRYVNDFRLEGLFVAAADPVAAAARWARFTGLIPQRTDEGIRLETARGSVLVAKRFAWRTPASPALAGYQLACRHPQEFAARCSAAGIRVKQVGSRYAAQLPAVLGGLWVF
jgi:hypothetical protein